jgi:UTP--glucose-1-phosphate uridylyltransferase
MLTENTDERFNSFATKMRAAEMPDIAINNFHNLYHQLIGGSTGNIAEAKIQAVPQLPCLDNLDQHYFETGARAMSETVLLKLNGGLGTSMGLTQAKSLIKIKDDSSFLDIIAQQSIHSKVQLVLMNSFNTRQGSLAELSKYPKLGQTISTLDFVQHKTPKIKQNDFSPAVSDHNTQLEWHPPGHGDIYIALQSSGMLEKLLDAGFRYALISNADNLGAVLDERLLGYMVDEAIPFLMEVTTRTNADKKGGHLAQLEDGRLILRESAQCMSQDRDDFENIEKHTYFNTNNLWLDLEQLKQTLSENNNILDLPLIRNSKTLDPKDMSSMPVYQLETAMGSAISIINGARAIEVSRNRFAPVKTTEDLLSVRSDVYKLEDDFTFSNQLALTEMPSINLDSNFYKMIDDFDFRFAEGVPSLIECQHLQVKGDIVFGKNIVIKGNVKLENNSDRQISIAANTCIRKNMSWD